MKKSTFEFRAEVRESLIRIENLLLQLIMVLADEDADKAKAKALLAAIEPRTAALKAAIGSTPPTP